MLNTQPERPMRRLMRLASLSIIGCLLQGCCTSPVGNVPFSVWDAGVKHQIVEHLSIKKMLLENGDNERSKQDLIDVLRRKFPENLELLTFLKQVESNTQKHAQKRGDFLREIKTEMDRKTGSELYYYESPHPKGFLPQDEVGCAEQGWPILYHGKVDKKYIIAMTNAPPSAAGSDR